MDNTPIFLTHNKIRTLKAELYEREQVIRQKIADAIGISVDTNSDLRENSGYDQLLEDQQQNEYRIHEIKYLIKNSSAIKYRKSDKAELGCEIILVDLNSKSEMKFTLVSEYESDPLEGKLSDTSAIGKLILGKKCGDSIEHSGILYRIDKIK